MHQLPCAGRRREHDGQVPAGDLDLTDGPSDDEADQFKAYRELLFGDVGSSNCHGRRS